MPAHVERRLEMHDEVHSKTSVRTDPFPCVSRCLCVLISTLWPSDHRGSSGGPAGSSDVWFPWLGPRKSPDTPDHIPRWLGTFLCIHCCCFDWAFSVSCTPTAPSPMPNHKCFHWASTNIKRSHRMPPGVVWLAATSRFGNLPLVTSQLGVST